MPRRRPPDPPGDDEVEDTGPEPMVPGVARALSPLARRILCPNPGLMTGPGTNTYLVGIDEVVVIDPGPEDDAHLEAILGCGGDRIRWIALTHTHPDHAPGATALAERTGAEIVAWPARGKGVPRIGRKVADGDTIEATEFRLTAVHTPGHASNHVCWYLEEERLLFTGDHVMQGSTVVITPPDGDMAAYLDSLAKVRRMRLKAIAPGHGHVIEDPAAVLDHYVTHRLAREAKVAMALADAGSATIAQLLPIVYDDVPDALHPVARYSLWAHLLKLVGDGRAEGRTLTGTWRAT